MDALTLPLAAQTISFNTGDASLDVTLEGRNLWPRPPVPELPLRYWPIAGVSFPHPTATSSG